MVESREKHCETCGRPFQWRKKWAKDWEKVRYCSRACQGGPSAIDGRAERLIIELLQERSGKSVCPSEVARRMSASDWRPLMEVVRRAARRLVLTGTIEITQGGKRVAHLNFKGPIRLKLS